jgi:hypothetical protein
MPASSGMARRFDRDKDDVLSEQDLKQLRENLSRLSPQGVRDFYDRAHEDCRLIYTRLPTPRKIQTLVQVWKQLGGEMRRPDGTFPNSNFLTARERPVHR